MSHSVQRHLEVAPAVYDVEIRRFVPAYEQMLGEVVDALREHLPKDDARIVDLGAGTGGLSGWIAERMPAVRLLLLDADAQMLVRAEERMRPFADRVELRHGFFSDALPSVDAAVASLSLHHVHDREGKVAVYANVHRALPAGGVLVIADATIPADPSLRDPLRKRWASHLIANGDTDEQARARFTQWDLEDRFFGVDEELVMLREGGFASVDVRFRSGPMTVLVARKG